MGRSLAFSRSYTEGDGKRVNHVALLDICFVFFLFFVVRFHGVSPTVKRATHKKYEMEN